MNAKEMKDIPHYYHQTQFTSTKQSDHLQY